MAANLTIKLVRFRGYDKLTENILANPVYGIKADESNEFLRNSKVAISLLAT
jgi:hypothetical protein